MESQTKCNATIGANIPNTSAKGANGRVPAKYQLLDLHRLTFTLEGHEQPFDVERDLINELWTFCEAEGFDFPLTEVPDEAAQEEGA